MEVVCVPSCPQQLTPAVGRTFSTIEEAMLFYYTYADACGFTPRKSTKRKARDGTVMIRYMLCNREGSKAESAHKRQRKTTTIRVQCMARIAFHFEAGVGYRIKKFVEGHSHSMLAEDLRYLLKSNRRVDPVHKMFIHAGVKANVGPVRTFRLYKEIVGSYENVGATKVDFKNYSRDLKAHVDGVDAQIIINNFKARHENCDGFKYFHDLDKHGKLNRLFWADKMSVTNYHMFGDAVSFDATYSTNRYKMIFTPFTGRDNHGGCVVFGAALISHEDVESYKWVLEKFVECMKTKQYN